MRRISALVCVVLALALARSLPAQTPQLPAPAATAPDGIAKLLGSLERALATNHAADFRALTSPALPADDESAFETLAFRDQQTNAAVRERDRFATPQGIRVLTEILIDRSGHGTLETWQIDVAPSTSDPNQFAITGLQRIAGIDGLYRLALNTTREFRVTNLTFTAVDFTLTMPSGYAYWATTEEGATAIVLRGQGEARFTPPDDTERGQLMIFAHKPEFVSALDTAFIRINPDEFDEHVSKGSFVPTTVVPDHATRAAAVFDERGQRAYHIGLGDLSSEKWSVVPPAGDALVEFLTSKYGWLSYARAANDPEDISFFDRQAHKNISVYASVERRRSRGRFYSDDDAAKFTIEQIDLDAHIDPDKSTASGTASLRIRILRDGVNTLQLRLAESLSVQSVTSAQLGRLLSLRNVAQNGLIVSLPAPLARGSELEVTIAYSGRLAPQGLDREAMTVDQDPTLTDVVPTPEPLFAYSNRAYWYPQSVVGDYSTARITLHVPSRFQVIATGSPAGPAAQVSGSERTMQFIADRPVRYLACVVSRVAPVGHATAQTPALAFPTAPELGGQVVKQLQSPSVAVDVVAHAREASDAKAYVARTAAIMGYYASIVGEAPYPTFSVAVVDGLIPSGHSPPYFAVLTRPVSQLLTGWRDDPVAFDDVPWFYLAHETAHQWWGQAVGSKNYHEQWLSEGLAQYFALRYVESERGVDVAHDVIARMRDTARAQAGAGPIYLGYRLGHIDSNTRAYRSVLYNKSAVVLHMLRQLIGGKAFDAGLRRYYHDQRFGKAGTQDLQFAFEIESQRQLGRFFDEWIMGADVPKLRVTTRIEAAGDAIVAHVDQTGTVFDVPITLLVTYDNGQTEPLIIGASEAAQDIRVTVPAGKGKARRVRVDEGQTLADFGKG